jgi:dTDP-glucose 4,6-dehydratase
VAIRDLVAMTAREMGIGLDDLCTMTKPRFGEDWTYWLDSSAIANDLGWQPETSLDEGIREMVDWGRKYIDQLQGLPQTYTFHA